MPERKSSALIGDMLKCIRRLQEYTSNISFDQFTFNFMIVEACLYNIQIIGEAVSKLPEDVKEAELQIPWASIKGMRNRLIHDYIGTDLLLVWNVIKNELPTFENDLERIHRSLIKQNR
jgi:uncharacterized protein with HEPN domain